MFTIIANIGQNRELGLNGDLCFRLKEDLKFFKNTTTGHPVVMGRKTWDSLPKKLPNRQNIVISHHIFDGPDQIIENLPDFIAKNRSTPEEYFIIGGAEIYYIFLPYAKKLLLTEVTASPKADVFFPDFDPTNYQHKIIQKGTENGLNFTISSYTKI